MFLSVKEMELRKLAFRESYAPGEWEPLDGKLKQASPLVAEGTAELVSRSLGEVRVRGHLSVCLDTECDRCLEAASIPIESDFDLFYEPMSLVPEEAEVEINQGESEIGFYKGEGLELEDILREWVLLALPMRKVCREDCQGICPVCGQNLNQKSCGCETRVLDNRWAALKGLK
jgi:uncharacterized protein